MGKGSPASSSTSSPCVGDTKQCFPKLQLLKVPTPAELQSDCDLVEQEGRLCIETMNGQQNLVDTSLLSRQPLENGPWLIEWDGGFGALAHRNDRDAPAPLLEDVAVRQLFRDRDGHSWVWDKKAPANRPVWSYTTVLERFTQVKITVRVTCLDTELDVDAFSMHWPRGGGGRYLISAQSVYKKLKLTTFSGKASKWVYDCAQKWMTYIDTFGWRGKHIFHGCRADRSLDSVDLDPAEAFLPAPALPVLSLLALLTRWQVAAPNAGGFRGPDRKAACGELLQGLLQGVYAGPWEITVEPRDDWTPPWPLLGQVLESVRLPVAADGMVSLATLFPPQGEPPPGAGGAANRWRTPLLQRGALKPNREINLADLVRATCCSDVLKSLHNQLLTAVSNRLQNRLYKNQCGKVPDGVMTCRAVDLMQLLWSSRQLDCQLLRHIASGIAYTAEHKNGKLSWTTDKANVCGVHLQSGAFALTNNAGGVLATQVGATSAGAGLPQDHGGSER